MDWPDLPAKQQPQWPDPGHLAEVLPRCRTTRRWSSPASATRCAGRLALASQGKAFVLQGGDCAETLAGVTGPNIRDRIKTILQMAVVLTYGAGMPIVKVGRMAGQFAKPRSPRTTRPVTG